MTLYKPSEAEGFLLIHGIMVLCDQNILFFNENLLIMFAKYLIWRSAIAFLFLLY